MCRLYYRFVYVWLPSGVIIIKNKVNLTCLRNFSSILGRQFVKRFTLCYQTVVCLSCLSVLSATVVYYGQTVGWIKMKPGLKVCLGPGHHLLHGDPAAPPKKKGGRAHQPPIFGSCLLWPNGWMDQDATWCRGRLRSRRHCVRWGSRSPKRGHNTPHFSTHVCCGQTTVWTKMPLGTEVNLISRPHCVRWGSTTPERGTTTPSFRPMSLAWGPSSPIQKRKGGTQQPPPNFRPMSIVAKRSPITATAELL